MNDQVQLIVDELIQYLDEEATKIIGEMSLDDARWQNAISTELTKTWLKKIAAKVKTEEELLERIEKFKAIANNQSYKLASSQGELAFLSHRLLEENSDLETTKKRLKQILADEPDISVSGLNLQNITTIESMQGKLREIIAVSSENAAWLIGGLLRNENFINFQEDSGYKIPPEYAEKEQYVKQNIKVQYLVAKEVATKLESISHFLKQRKKM